MTCAMFEHTEETGANLSPQLSVRTNDKFDSIESKRIQCIKILVDNIKR